MNSKSSLAKRFASALQCLAIADAVGYVYEFAEMHERQDREEILSLLDSLPCISDDTQMTLFTASAVMDIMGGTAPEQAFEEAYLNWYKTQIHDAPLPHDTGLNAYPELYLRAEPGLTCLSALKSLFNCKEVRNDSYGCGSVMRLLPIVLLFDRYNFDTCLSIAQISGSVTHKHSANAYAIEKLIRVYHRVITHGKMPDVDAGDDFTGWDAVSCVSAAIRANQLCDTFEDLVAWCVQNTEDCDSTAAVAASIWGLMHPAPEYKVKEQRVLDALITTI